MQQACHKIIQQLAAIDDKCWQIIPEFYERWQMVRRRPEVHFLEAAFFPSKNTFFWNQARTRSKNYPCLRHGRFFCAYACLVLHVRTSLRHAQTQAGTKNAIWGILLAILGQIKSPDLRPQVFPVTGFVDGALPQMAKSSWAKFCVGFSDRGLSFFPYTLHENSDWL